MNAAIYIRWSTDDQGTGTTLDVQREGCLKKAGEHGLTISPEHIFIDDGVSGAKENRPALNRLNRAIQNGSITTVIVYRLDRLARSPYVAYKLVERDWHKRASLISVTESHINTTTTEGQLGFGIATIFAAHERNTIRDRTMSGKRRRAAEGKNPGLRPHYGVQIIDKTFAVVEEEAITVRRIYNDYLKGRTDGQVARALNDAGIRTKAGGPWHTSAVQRILTNPAYKGTLVYRDITCEDAFPVIIDPHTWERAQAIRSEKAKVHPRRLATESPYILSGRLTCARCGRPMNGRVCRNGKYENRYYACTGYIQFRDCDCLTIRQEALESAVVAHLLPLLNEDELSRRIHERAGMTLDLLRQEVEALELRLRNLDQELFRVRQDYRHGKIEADTFNELRTEIEADKKTAAGRLSGRRSELIRAEDASKAGGCILEAANLLGSWDGLSHTQRRQIVHLLTERILWDCHSRQLIVHTAV